MNPKDSINKANQTLRFAQSLAAYLIAGAMSEYPEPSETQDLGFQLQNHLTAIDECIQALWEAAKAKPENDSPETMPAHNDVQRMLRIHDLIDAIEDEELKRKMGRVWLEVGKPFLGVELGFIEKSETPAATEGDQ